MKNRLSVYCSIFGMLETVGSFILCRVRLNVVIVYLYIFKD